MTNQHFVEERGRMSVKRRECEEMRVRMRECEEM